MSYCHAKFARVGALHLVLDPQTSLAVRVFVRTFIAAQLYVSKQSNLDNLPEESKHQVRFSLPQILGSDIDNLAADGRG